MRPAYDVIINNNSGRVKENRARIQSQILGTLGQDCRIAFADSRSIPTLIKDWRDTTAPDLERVLILGGGDGTVSTGAQLLAKTDHRWGALPLGTCNVFVRALYGTADISAILESLKDPSPHDIDMGTINNKPFLIAASLEPLFISLAAGRENIREKRHLRFITHLPAIFNGLVTTPPARPHRENRDQYWGPSGVIINGQLGKSVSSFAEDDYPTSWAQKLMRGYRPEFAEDLSYYRLDSNHTLERIRAVSRFLRSGDWQDMPVIKLSRHNELEILPALRNTRPSCPALLDGERYHVNLPATIRKGTVKARVWGPDPAV